MRWSFPTAPPLAALLTACVTVNVYFPAAAAQQAADQIIDRVTGQAGGAGAPASTPAPNPSSAPAPTPGTQGVTPGSPDTGPGSTGAPPGPTGAGQAAPGSAPAPRPPPQTSLAAPHAPIPSLAVHPLRATPSARAEEWMRASLALVIEHVIPAAHAQGSPNLDISTPQIRAITDSMRGRFSQLEPFFASGAVGMTADGMVAVRDLNAVPLAQRALVTRLVADDNRDRTALYAEIARANGHPEWEPDIRRTFAQRWVARGAQPGWYYQDASGSWRRK